MLLTPWKGWQGPHPLDKLQMQYTLHSMKATLLSFGPQLGSLVSDSDRLLQGHHHDPKRSLNLYGRDSVWGSLRYQQTVITEVQKGWRPKTAQHRGGQFPMVEPTVTLERFKKTAPEYNFVWLPFAPQVDPQESSCRSIQQVMMCRNRNQTPAPAPVTVEVLPGRNLLLVARRFPKR